MKLSLSMRKNETRIGWVYLVFQLLVLPSLLVSGNRLLGAPFSDMALNFAMYVINFAAVAVIFHNFLLSSLRLSLGNPFRWLRSAVLGFGIYYIGTLLFGLVIGKLYPGFSNVNDANIIILSKQNYVLMELGTVLLVPVAEETLYRGLIFQGLQRTNRVAAYIVSIAVFCAIHVVGYIGLYDPLLLLLCFVQYIPAGFALAWAYERADSIWAPILMHIAINQIGMLSMR